MHDILLILGVIGCILKGVGVKVGRVSIGWLGLAAFIGSFLVR